MVSWCRLRDVLARLNYIGHEDVPTAYPWRTNEMSQIMLVKPENLIVVSENEGVACNRAVRLEQ